MLTSPDNKKYIGQTIQGFTKRMYGHKHGKSYCRALRNAINHFGFDTFKKEIIWECDNCSLCDMEKYYINTYDTLYPNGYNSYDSMGEFYYNEGDMENAMKFYTKAKEMYPSAVSANTMISEISKS